MSYSNSENYELISANEYENLPEDNDQCFVQFEHICRRNMNRMIDADSSNDFDRAVKEQYMTSVYAVAQECKIPDVDLFETGDGFYRDFSLFSLAVQGAVARIRIRSRGIHHPYSVLLTSSTRTKIEHYIGRIRDAVDQSDLDYDKKKALAAKLDELAAELSQRRFGFAKSMAILIGISTVLSASVTTLSDGDKALIQIMRLIGIDKESEEAASKRLTPPSKALPSPKTRPPATTKQSATQKPSYDLDDDIPF
ncbi:hypothetical protein [Methylorubrum populi]